jgi:hypothetical protein
MQSILPQPWSFLYPYLPYMHVLEIGDVGAFCSVDPPTYTLPTALEFAGFVTGGNLGYVLTVQTFFSNLVKSYLWYSLCQCSVGSPTAHPAADSDPGDLPAINPPDIVSLPDRVLCFDLDTGFIGFPATNPGAVAIQGTDTNLGGSSTAVAIPPGLTSFDLIVERQAAGSVHAQVTCSGNWFADNAAGLGNIGGFTGVSVLSTATGPNRVRQLVPATARFWHINLLVSGTTNVSDLGRLQIQGACYGGSLDGTQQACCLPDPLATGYLSRILTAVELIQRQAAPFGYVAGTTHSGLSDNGSLTIADLIGVKIEVTSLPDSYGRLAGDPIEYFGLGFLTWGTTDGYRSSTPLEHEFQVIFPPLAGVYTSLGYSLAPGVVVTVTELVREP